MASPYTNTAPIGTIGSSNVAPTQGIAPIAPAPTTPAPSNLAQGIKTPPNGVGYQTQGQVQAGLDRDQLNSEGLHKQNDLDNTNNQNLINNLIQSQANRATQNTKLFEIERNNAAKLQQEQLRQFGQIQSQAGRTGTGQAQGSISDFYANQLAPAASQTEAEISAREQTYGDQLNKETLTNLQNERGYADQKSNSDRYFKFQKETADRNYTLAVDQFDKQFNLTLSNQQRDEARKQFDFLSKYADGNPKVLEAAINNLVDGYLYKTSYDTNGNPVRTLDPRYSKLDIQKLKDSIAYETSSANLTNRIYEAGGDNAEVNKILKSQKLSDLKKLDQKDVAASGITEIVDDNQLPHNFGDAERANFKKGNFIVYKGKLVRIVSMNYDKPFESTWPFKLERGSRSNISLYDVATGETFNAGFTTK